MANLVELRKTRNLLQWILEKHERDLNNDDIMDIENAVVVLNNLIARFELEAKI